MLFSIFLNLALVGIVLSASVNGSALERSALAGDETPQPRQLSTTCGQRRSRSVERIVGGTEAGVNEFPWRAALYVVSRNGGEGYFCSGTILSDTWILTAAHCTTGAKDQGYSVAAYLGDHDLSTTRETRSQRIAGSQMIEHPRYNKNTFDNDIALIKLKSRIAGASNVGPICLPCTLRNANFSGTTVTASGWGTEEEGNNDTPDRLRKVDLTVLTTEECRKYYGSQITNNMICTYKAGKDTCQGDSGGSIDLAASRGYTAIGVVSWGVGCARQNRPGVYTKVGNYIDWIESTTGQKFC